MMNHGNGYNDFVHGKHRYAPGCWFGENIFDLAPNELPYWLRIKPISLMTRSEIVNELRRQTQ
jgi:hypothetical protein